MGSTGRLSTTAVAACLAAALAGGSVVDAARQPGANPVPGQGRSTADRFHSSRFDYSFSVPAAVTVHATDTANRDLELLAVVIDPAADPVFVCAATNQAQWTSQRLFDAWRTRPPRTGMFEFPCGEYPTYAKWDSSPVTIDGLPAVRVASRRGEYLSVCTYLATPRFLLVACLPAEDVGAARQTVHQTAYEQIVSSIRSGP